jgi:hypothetical protein
MFSEQNALPQVAENLNKPSYFAVQNGASENRLIKTDSSLSLRELVSVRATW